MSASRLLLAGLYGAIGALFGFLIGYFLIRPLLALPILPSAFHVLAVWSPLFVTIIVGAIAALGYLKSEK